MQQNQGQIGLTYFELYCSIPTKLYIVRILETNLLVSMGCLLLVLGPS